MSVAKIKKNTDESKKDEEKELNKKGLEIGVIEEEAYKEAEQILFLDGTLTPAKFGGECVGYSGRRKIKSTNSLFLCDKKQNLRYLIQCTDGNHNDTFELCENLDKSIKLLKDKGLIKNNAYLNADQGFDDKKIISVIKNNCLIPNIHKNKRNTKQENYVDYDVNDKVYSVRCMNEVDFGYIDNFRGCAVRYERKINHFLLNVKIVNILHILTKISKK